MGNIEVLVTLIFFKMEIKNFVSWCILMQIFQKVIYFQIQSFYDVNNFAIFEGRSPEAGVF